MNHKYRIILTCIIAITGIIALGAMLIVDRIALLRQEEKNIQYEKILNDEKRISEEAQNLILRNNSELDLLEYMHVREMLDFSEMSDCANYISGYNTNAAIRFSIREKLSLNDDRFYMIVFAAHTDEKAASLSVSLDGAVTEYYITCQPSAFYLPIESTEDIKVVLGGDFQNTYIQNICIVETDELLPERYRQYDITDIQEIGTDSGKQVSNLSCRSVLTSGDYVYALVKNELDIYRNEENDCALVSKVKDLGNTVHMAFAADSILVVTSRENDVFFIDVSIPENATIVSTYDSLDLATGIETCEGYAFICSRYYGVEIVDISNVFKPKLCAIINTGGECIECCINDGYLYISNWNLKKVFVYDVGNPNEPRQVNQINTDGNPYGCLIKDSNLIVATGHHAANNYDSIEKGGYGAGHGMEIYDISNPSKIKWNSTVKADGRLYYRALDNWGVYANGNYVYMASTYSGVYVYDITNVYNPKRVLKISFRINNSDERYSYSDNDGYVFPYNPHEYLIEPISGIAFGENSVYLAGQNMGLYMISMETEKTQDKKAFEKIEPNNGEYFGGRKI